MNQAALDRIHQLVTENPVVLFMKGTPGFPQCGFSNTAAQAVKACGVEFRSVNVLLDPEIFENLKHYANWPTFPQLYIKGELIGGADITKELFDKGELQKLLEGLPAKN
jgi:monothiol glutaredoxin